VKADHVVIDTKRRVIECGRCFEFIPLPLGAIPWVVAVGNAFTRVHRYCKQRDQMDGNPSREPPLCYFAKAEP
jgi:hypothetical protein